MSGFVFKKGAATGAPEELHGRDGQHLSQDLKEQCNSIIGDVETEHTGWTWISGLRVGS